MIRFLSLALALAILLLPELPSAASPDKDADLIAIGDTATADEMGSVVDDLIPSATIHDPQLQEASRCAPSCQCQSKKKPAKPSPCATSHKGLYYNNDFSYLDDPNYNGHCLGDCLKLMPIDNCGRYGTLDVGGQLRLRYHHERGMGQEAGATRFEDTENDFMLTRLRLYTNWQMSPWFRVYVEGIFADVTADSDYIPRGIDRNYGDFLNLFFDVKLTDHCTVRVGRQELLYGVQRLISPLDWANTRRTFEGIKVIAKEGNWQVDGFFTHFVPVNPFELDEADYNQPFYGCNVAYGGFENFTLETYYIGYDNQNPGSITSNFSIHTAGVRVNGGLGDWLFAMEGGPQFGRQMGLGVNQEAAFYTCGIGHNLGSSLPWTPTLWAYYDYASGDAMGGDFNRFNQLFPLAHKYFGFIDAVQRANMEAPNLLLTMKPAKKLTFLCWYWHFMANQGDDIVPSLGGTPAQNNSKDFGDELDFIAAYKFGPRSNILLGWSHFWRGNKILAPVDADFVYTQWELNF